MDIKTRFWTKVNRRGPDECWPWTAAKRGWGYGSLKAGGRMLSAHRIAWELTNGAIPAGLCVLHRCDNPPCVNPAHLWLGTVADNNRDREDKGRSAPIQRPAPGQLARGGRCPSAKLTAGAVRKIRSLAGHVRQVDLAARFGVTQAAVSKVVLRQIWAHV